MMTQRCAVPRINIVTLQRVLDFCAGIHTSYTVSQYKQDTLLVVQQRL